MDYLNKAINLEDKLYSALEKDELNKFQELLELRQAMYKGFAEESPKQFKDYLNSEIFMDIKGKINKLYEEKRESVRKEMRELALSRKAADGYLSNSGIMSGMFSKTV